MYRDAIETLAGMQITNCTNIAVVALRQDRWGEALAYCNEALELDHRHVKALYLKGKVFIEMTDYVKAI